VLAVDLYGSALVFEEFGRIIAAGGAGLIISSMAGHMLLALTPEQDKSLDFSPTDELLDVPFLKGDAVPNSMVAYMIAKGREPPSRAGRGYQLGRTRRTGELDQPRHHF